MDSHVLSSTDYFIEPHRWCYESLFLFVHYLFDGFVQAHYLYVKKKKSPPPIWIVTVNWKSLSFKKKKKSQHLIQCLAYSRDSMNVCGMCEQISHYC